MRVSNMVYRAGWIKSVTGRKRMEAKTATVITIVKHEVRLREWTAQIEAQQASGMTVQGWCAENGISPKTYYYRLRKVREQCIASASAIVPLAMPNQTNDIHINKNGLRITLPAFHLKFLLHWCMSYAERSCGESTNLPCYRLH